jgi:hypothetical protein
VRLHCGLDVLTAGALPDGESVDTERHQAEVIMVNAVAARWAWPAIAGRAEIVHGLADWADMCVLWMRLGQVIGGGGNVE